MKLPLFKGEHAPPEFDFPFPIALPLTFMELGYVTVTPGAMKLFEKNNLEPSTTLEHFRRGDWGEVDFQDHANNSRALEDGGPIMGVYTNVDTSLIWIICVPYDHTTILTPDEAN